jgi:hypothetical protein
MNSLCVLLLLCVLATLNVYGFTVRPSVVPSRIAISRLSLSSSEPETTTSAFVPLEENAEDDEEDDDDLLEKVELLGKGAAKVSGSLS